VFFIDASRDFGNDHNRSRLRDKDIQRILGTFRARAEERQYARLVSYEEIECNDFNLNIPRYIKKLDEDSTDLERLQREIARLDRELMQARTELSAAVHRLEP
jgi:type I restriction enzyme M protein